MTAQSKDTCPVYSKEYMSMTRYPRDASLLPSPTSRSRQPPSTPFDLSTTYSGKRHPLGKAGAPRLARSALTSSSSTSSRVLRLMTYHLVQRTVGMVRPIETRMRAPPNWYRGSWLVRKKYGVNQCEAVPKVFAIAKSAAF